MLLSLARVIFLKLWWKVLIDVERLEGSPKGTKDKVVGRS